MDAAYFKRGDVAGQPQYDPGARGGPYGNGANLPKVDLPRPTEQALGASDQLQCVLRLCDRQVLLQFMVAASLACPRDPSPSNQIAYIVDNVYSLVNSCQVTEGVKKGCER